VNPWQQLKVTVEAATGSQLKISEFPDPEGVYASMLTIANIDKSTVDIPEIRDGNGVLINPAEYEDKLESGIVVMVVAYLKV
jgi:hypothetical protein